MIEFGNRLSNKFGIKKLLKLRKFKKPLRGKELVNYVESHREGLQGDGDTLCVEAGYGEYDQKGHPICNFKPFVKELSQAMELENKENLA